MMSAESVMGNVHCEHPTEKKQTGGGLVNNLLSNYPEFRVWNYLQLNCFFEVQHQLSPWNILE